LQNTIPQQRHWNWQADKETLSTKYLLHIVTVSALFTAGCRTAPTVRFVPGDNKIDVLIGQNHFTSYRYGGQLTKPVLFPLRSPSGIQVNRSYPLADVEGESKDHPHHAGLFFSYDNVNNEGFWNNTSSPPQIRHVKVTETTGGAGNGKLSTLMHWVGKAGNILLVEKRDMFFRAGVDEYIIDFSIDLTAYDRKVVFSDTKEGMFAIRVADWLREKGGTGRYLSSDGHTNEKNIWGTRAAWVRLQGQKNGKVIGIVIANHPASVNYPTYWHVRGYGLFSANPLGQYVFEKTLKQSNPRKFNLTLAPGQTAHFGFRVIIYEGPRTLDQIHKVNFKVFD